VTHIDAAQNVVAWARRNAELSGLAEAPIRWIAEDAMKFASRELKRGNRYDAVILDPPSYGHGPAGEVWKIEDDLETLLYHGRFMLLTCHSPGFGIKELWPAWREAMGHKARGRIVAKELCLATSPQRRLPCGTAARWESEE
jgi:23S rRNA (cytosine1962-C5)-methyltransferase